MLHEALATAEAIESTKLQLLILIRLVETYLERDEDAAFRYGDRLADRIWAEPSHPDLVQAYYVLYRLYAGHDDERAHNFLRMAYGFVCERIDNLNDHELRQSVWNVPLHREIVAAWNRGSAAGERSQPGR
ncbi:MAG: hypothetical protein ABEL51_09830 [Salinibacter sp.]